MSDPEPEVVLWDAPNQQVVRPDQSPPWEEGEGGSTGPHDPDPVSDLDAMTKDQLLAYAQERGISPANASMSKDDIRASIDAAAVA
jgi:hypothetical protein